MSDIFLVKTWALVQFKVTHRARYRILLLEKLSLGLLSMSILKYSRMNKENGGKGTVSSGFQGIKDVHIWKFFAGHDVPSEDCSTITCC